MYDLDSSKVVINNYTNCFVPLKDVGHGNTAVFAVASVPSFRLVLRGKVFRPVMSSP